MNKGLKSIKLSLTFLGVGLLMGCEQAPRLVYDCVGGSQFLFYSDHVAFVYQDMRFEGKISGKLLEAKTINWDDASTPSRIIPPSTIQNNARPTDDLLLLGGSLRVVSCRVKKNDL